MPSEVELAWLAGLLDGEGSFGISKSRYQCSIQLEMTHEPTVLMVAQLFRDMGVTALTYSYAGRVRVHRRSYYVRVNRQADILRVCRALKPYVVTKLDQVTAMEKYLEGRLAGVTLDSSGRRLRGGHLVGRKPTQIESEIVESLALMNSRGV